MSKKSNINDEKELKEENVQDSNTITEENPAAEEEVTVEEPANEGNDEVPEEEELQEETKEPSLEEQLTDAKDKYLRLSAEFDNYRKRTLKEKAELTKMANESLLLNMLPVVDDFERGMQSMNDASEIEAVKAGMLLIHNKFKEFLKRNGVKEIEAREKEFDVDLHEAITKIPAPTDTLKGKVVDVVEKGYTMNEKVIRYAKVVVGE